MKLSEHFDSEEFRCHDGSPLPANFPDTIRDTVEFLEALRFLMNAVLYERTGEWKNRGIYVVSGHRPLAYNLRIGSSKTSQHIAGTAADVRPSNWSGITYKEFRDMAEIIDQKVFPDRPYRIGTYTKSKFVHIDCGYGHGGRRWGS